MIQKTYSVEDLVHKTVVRTKPRYGQSVVRFTQVILGAVRKLVVAVLEGFHTFVEVAEQHRTPHNDYWWDSPDKTQCLFKKQ
jgi:hypothetical protein